MTESNSCTTSQQIVASRDAIRQEVITRLSEYMDLDNIDLTQSSFLSFIIDLVSSLTSNLMFYQSSIYKEFFLTTAQLPESIYNLSAFLGYTPSSASYATSNILMTVSLPFNDPNTDFTIPEGFSFKTPDNVKFVTFYDTNISLTNGTAVSATINDDGAIYDLPTFIDTTSEMNFQFVLPVRQYEPQEQQLMVDENLQPFQFSEIDVPITGKVANVEVYVLDPDVDDIDDDDSGRLYTEFSSLYLMGSDDYGYVMRTTSEGKRLYFGNGLIGKQPIPGATVRVKLDVTEGAAGNAIAGSITTGERIYSQQALITTIVDYTCVNASPATGGADEESLQDIRSNSIASLASLHRLVTEGDYQVADVVMTDSPLAANSIPVLKRSDLKCNEIQLFTTLQFGDDIVPSRNIFYTDTTAAITYIPRGTLIDVDSVNYITLFDMTLDYMNSAAFYHYIMYELEVVPLLIESWQTLHFHLSQLTIARSGQSATFTLDYFSNETDADLYSCEMRVLSTGDTYTMTNNGPGTQTLSYTFADYLNIPDGSETYFFTISDASSAAVNEYSATFVFRQELKEFMLSNTIVDGTSVTIYDIPAIKQSYYNSIDQRDFESDVLQTFLSSMDLKSYRMLTDFTNVKLCNTTGNMYNMLRNTPTISAIAGMGQTTIPTGISTGDRYIVSGVESPTWSDYRDYIAMCTDATAGIWTFIQPSTNDVAYVNSESSVFVYSPYGWMKPIYEIPLKIKAEVIKEADSGVTEAALTNNIKETLLSTFEGRFGANMTLHRSELIEAIQGVTGVSYCRLIEPQTSIFFEFDINDFTQQELMEYAPEWIYFTEDDISIILLSSE